MTNKNPLGWNRGFPYGANSRPRDLEDQLVFDGLSDLPDGIDDIAGFLDLFKKKGTSSSTQKPLVNIQPFGGIKNMAIAAVVGSVLGLLIGYKLGSR
jgi:hypothetical protein